MAKQIQIFKTSFYIINIMNLFRSFQWIFFFISRIYASSCCLHGFASFWHVNIRNQPNCRLLIITLWKHFEVVQKRGHISFFFSCQGCRVARYLLFELWFYCAFGLCVHFSFVCACVAACVRCFIRCFLRSYDSCLLDPVMSKVYIK